MTFRRAAAALVLAAVTTFSSTAYASPSPPDHERPQLEKLDRGLIATTTSEGVFLSWRLLGKEATGSTDHGLTGTDFTVYRDGKRIATVTDSTNYLDKTGTQSSRYRVVSSSRATSETAATPSSPGPTGTATSHSRSQPTGSPRQGRPTPMPPTT